MMPSASAARPPPADVPQKENLVTSHIDKISKLDARYALNSLESRLVLAYLLTSTYRMIRDDDLDIHDEELLGFEPDYTSRLG